MLMRRQRTTLLVLLAMFVAVAAALAVAIHDIHVHDGHVHPIEERIELIECRLGLQPGLDTSDDWPFFTDDERAECPAAT